jgi:hypothetical protein
VNSVLHASQPHTITRPVGDQHRRFRDAQSGHAIDIARRE